MNPFEFFLPWKHGVDTHPLVPGMLRFGGGGGGTTVVNPSARVAPPAAPAPLAPSRPTQSVADLITQRRKLRPESKTVLTSYTGEDTGRRTILGLPLT
jgi:hypothetical protein